MSRDAARAAAGAITFRPFSVVFDGATNVAEVFCLLVRFVTNDGFLQQHVIALEHLAASMTAADVCGVVSKYLLNEGPVGYVFGSQSVLAFMSDRAAVNICALDQMLPLFFNAERVGCLSHTIANAGRKMENSDSIHTFLFISKWVQIVGRSPLARLKFKETTGIAAKRSCLTRWYGPLSPHDLHTGTQNGRLLNRSQPPGVTLAPSLSRLNSRTLRPRTSELLSVSTRVQTTTPFASRSLRLLMSGGLFGMV